MFIYTRFQNVLSAIFILRMNRSPHLRYVFKCNVSGYPYLTKIFTVYQCILTNNQQYKKYRSVVCGYDARLEWIGVLCLVCVEHLFIVRDQSERERERPRERKKNNQYSIHRFHVKDFSRQAWFKTAPSLTCRKINLTVNTTRSSEFIY